MKRTLFTIASMLVVATLLLTACQPAETEVIEPTEAESPATEVVTEAPTEAPLTGTVTLCTAGRTTKSSVSTM